MREDLYIISWVRLHKARKVEEYYQTLCGTANRYLKNYGWMKPLSKNDERIIVRRDLCSKCFGKDKYTISAWEGVVE